MQRIITESSVPPPGAALAGNLLHAYANLLLCMDKYAGDGRAVPDGHASIRQFVKQTDKIVDHTGVRLIEESGSAQAQQQQDAHEFFLLFLDKLAEVKIKDGQGDEKVCLLYTSPSPRDATLSRMPSSA